MYVLFDVVFLESLDYIQITCTFYGNFTLLLFWYFYGTFNYKLQITNYDFLTLS